MLRLLDDTDLRLRRAAPSEVGLLQGEARILETLTDLPEWLMLVSMAMTKAIKAKGASQ